MSFDRTLVDVEAGEYPRDEQWERLVDHAVLLDTAEQDASYYTGGAAASSTTTEVALTAWTAAPTYTAKAGTVYKLTWGGYVYNAAGAYSTIERVQVQIRQAVNSIVATALGSAIFDTQGTSGSGATYKTFHRYVKNTADTDKTGIAFGVTALRVTGAAANVVYGDASLIMELQVRRVGLITDYANYAAMAVALT